jgi:hypothetical protein
VFGIALLGAIVTGRFTSALGGALSASGFAPDAQAKIIAAATHGRGGGGQLPAGIDPVALKQVIGSSFVAGMHRGMFVAGVALALGSVLAFAFVRPIPAQATQPEKDLAVAVA